MKFLVRIGCVLLFATVCYARLQSVTEVAKALERTFLKLGKRTSVTSGRRVKENVWTKTGLTKTGTQPAPAKVDLVFVVDRSGSIGKYKLGLAFKFVKELVRYFSVSPATTRVALITYSTSVQTVFDFKKFVNRECVNKELDKRRNSFGWTATGPALQRAIQLYRSSSSGSRSDAERLVFVLTDGRSNRGVKPSIPASILKTTLNAKVFALGIANYVRAELETIASSPSYVYELLTFQLLQQVTAAISKKPFDSCSGYGTRYDECDRRCTCIGGKLKNCCRVRKDFTSMSLTERQRFISALRLISTRSPYKQRFDYLVRIHKQEFGNGIHDLNQFLPWHRYYSLEFENLLRQVNCRITLPYWDWSLWAHDPWNLNEFWASSSSGFGGNGIPGGGCVKSGVFRYPGWSLITGSCLERNFNGNPPDAAQVQYCLSLNNFYDFEVFLRVNLHNSVHCRIDGTMCSIDSANAPEFHMHHGFVDKIWNDWQRKSASNLNAHFPGVSQLPMRASPYYARELQDNNNLPGCVRVCYDEPTHGESERVLKFVKGLTGEQVTRLQRRPFSRVSEKSHRVFRVSSADRLRARRLEDISRRGIVTNMRKRLVTTTERKTGFKLVKPTFTDVSKEPWLDIVERRIKIEPYHKPRFEISRDEREPWKR